MKFYLSPWYSVCTKEILISEGSYGYGEPKNVICISVQKPYRPVRACKSPRFELRRIVPSMDFFAVMKFYLSPWYSVCTKEILISEGSYGYGKPKNLICISVQKPYRPVRA